MMPVITRLRRICLYVLLGAAFCFVLPQKGQATHLMGGDLTYRCVSGDTYEFTLTLYRDCAGIPLSTANQRITLFSNSCGIQEFNVDLTFLTFGEISPICPAQQPNSTCNGGTVAGVEEYIFQATYTLPQQCNDWTAYYVRCCRNGAITNLANPNSQRIYIEATLNNLDVTCNSSPVFTNKPVPFLCNLSPYLFNNGSIDVDGDSLAFELIDPRTKTNGPATDIPFVGGFSPSYPLATAPANAFNFDPLSGQMSFTPNGLQQAVVTVRVKEYRNGVLIGTVLRDIQLVVFNCTNQSPFLDPPSNISGAVFNGNTFSVCAGSTLNFDLRATDPDAGDLLTFTSNVQNALPGATFTQTIGNPNVGSVNWPTTIADTGTYFISFLLQDNGCPLIASQVVGYNIIVQPATTYPPQNNFVCPTNSNTVNLQSSIPNTGGTYTWSPTTGLNNPNIQNPVATIPNSGTMTYYVTYSDTSACAAVEEVNITPAGAVGLPDTVEVCMGDSVQLSANFVQFGPNQPFTFTWDPPTGLSSTTIGNPMASPTSTTTYTVTASTLNCSFAADVVVEVIEIPVILTIPADSICANDSTTLMPNGTNLNGATFSWSPISGMNDPNILNPTVGPNQSQVYTLTAGNQCGSGTASTPITVFSPLNVSLSVQDVNCQGANDGAIAANVSGGNGAPDYLWSPGGSTASGLSNLGPGIYSVLVSDAAGCSAASSVTLVEPPALLPSLVSQVNVNCFGGSDGSLLFNASGGTPGYQYSLNGGTYQSSPDFQNLPAGTYNLTVRDSRMCESQLGPFQITEPNAPVLVQVIATVAAGCNSTLGQITVQASGGTGPYSFRLNNGPNQAAPVFSGLGPGTYTIRATDANGCIDLVSTEISVITDPRATLDSLGGVSCFGGSDGFVRISLSGGQGPYLTSIDGSAFGIDTVFTNLDAGLHTVVMSDASSPPCSYSLTVDIPQPDSLVAQILNQTDISCFGGMDGDVLLTAQGGTRPYTYANGNGPFSIDSLFSILPADSYLFNIEDANGCMDTVSTTLIEPADLVLSGGFTAPLCFGDANGSLQVSAAGGTPPYAYSFENGPMVADTSFGGLTAGDYQIVVEDFQGCTDTLIIIITQPDEVSLVVDNILAIACFGDSTGQINLVGSGGTLPYSFAMPGDTFGPGSNFTGLAMGNYRFLMRDANGCLTGIDTSLNEPPALTGDLETENISCFGADDGRAELSVAGGTPPYSYAWSDNGPSQAVRGALPPGSFWAEGIDDNGCIILFLGEIIEPDSMQFDSTATVDVDCFGEATGEVLVSVRGGTEPYVYDWSNGGTDSAQIGVPAGTYFITVTDSNECEINDTLIVNESPQLLVSDFEISDAFCDWDNGELSVLVEGGVQPYEYIWDALPGINTDMLTGLAAGDSVPPYTLEVIDSLGCILRDTFEVGREPAPIAAFRINPPFADTLIWSELPIEFINESQFSNLFQWQFGDGGLSELENPTHAYDEPGFYPVCLIAYDSRFLCPDTAKLDLNLLPPGQIFFPNAFTPNGDGNNEYFFPVGEGILALRLRIFSRWGMEIRNIVGASAKWDGLDKRGQASPEGVYVFVAEARLNDGSIVKRSGTVTLYR
ncbi:MAG: PKD domain-containing protein [Bacteroidota bacterium]